MDLQLSKVLEKYSKNPSRLMDILLDVQSLFGYISCENTGLIAKELGISKSDVQQTMSFYHFFSCKPKGKYTIYLNNSVVSCMMGRQDVALAFEEAAGCKFGTTSNDGLIGLYDTACIGMNDQEPAALINGVVFTKLNIKKAKEIIAGLKSGRKPEDFITEPGDGKNNSPLLKTMVHNNIKRKGQVLFSEYQAGTALKKLASMSQNDVISEIKKSYIRGRGGAGFPTGLKWEFCKMAPGNAHYVVCNADEGEPGTFKDRVLLTEKPELLFEGMAVAGYAIGAKEGILYLRYEYKYMLAYLENVLSEMRSKHFLGNNISGISGFDFDIRIQLGAGAYVCGEESALIESAEGKRGEPRNRPPFPVQKGYLNQPTSVNNVETLCAAVRIVEKGGDWYKAMGTKDSTGTKLLSISGDCKYPGIYEIEWGMTIFEMLDLAGATNTQAVQVGGPSGRCISAKEFKRRIAYEDLATGGAMIIIGHDRDLIKDVVLNFTEFFIDESCGSCVPCRTMTTALKHKLEDIIHGNGQMEDVQKLVKWGKMMKDLNRCGLGQSAANPVLTTIESFRDEYTSKISNMNLQFFEFDMKEAVKESCEYVGRRPVSH